jgi:hypothetical protein
MGAREVGRVAGLWRYPVKSMAAEVLEEVEVSWHGLAGDRRWAFVRDGIPRSGFPWMTIRERSDMGRYRPSFLDPARPDDSRTVVRTPGGAELEVVDPALAAELGDGVRVIKQDRGVFDAMPLSLVSTATLAALGELAGLELDAQRFRPNLLVEAVDAAPFQDGRHRRHGRRGPGGRRRGRGGLRLRGPAARCPGATAAAAAAPGRRASPAAPGARARRACGRARRRRPARRPTGAGGARARSRRSRSDRSKRSGGSGRRTSRPRRTARRAGSCPPTTCAGARA